jgi:hypothetical protein
VIALRSDDQDHGCDRRDHVWLGSDADEEQLLYLGNQDDGVVALMRRAEIWDVVELEHAKAIDEVMDQKALTAIYQGIPEDMIPLIAEKKMSAEAWETIKTNRIRDNRIKEVRVQMLKSKFDRLKMKDTESVDATSL